MGFFFFQAEDGIRDGRVTGVQTCALPISPSSARPGSTRSATSPSTPGPRPSPTNRRTGGGRSGKIGRASCRERGEISVVAASLKKKKDRGEGRETTCHYWWKRSRRSAGCR